MSDYKIVYSDDPNFKNRCQKCHNYPCSCPKAKEIIPKDHTLKLRLEKNQRGGKTVTVLYELPFNDQYFLDLTKKLKAHCGTGGTFKDSQIEIQGDHRDKIRSFLEKIGFKVKG